ncbi:hypothetical protein AAHZ94_03830 [Streptomyces sp. HSW2009]|uniref:hypothetical protein n=1 Tax=Streptomyces sp. HSW2009 TaxID=3142890 RepID=UPI0032EEEA26
MSASDPYQTHDGTVLITVLLAGPVVLAGLVTYLCVTLMQRRRRPPAAACRDLALLSAAASLGLYLWGCLHVAFAERAEIARACVKAAGARRVESFHGDFVPLRMVCRAEGGGSHTVLVPGYTNPSVAVTLALAVVLGAVAAVLYVVRRGVGDRGVGDRGGVGGPSGPGAGGSGEPGPGGLGEPGPDGPGGADDSGGPDVGGSGGPGTGGLGGPGAGGLGELGSGGPDGVGGLGDSGGPGVGGSGGQDGVGGSGSGGPGGWGQRAGGVRKPRASSSEP